jgi:glutamate racemase
MIGVLVSGIGGLAIVRAIRERNPAYDLIYFGDTVRPPYGHSKPDSIPSNLNDSIRFMIRRKIGRRVRIVDSSVCIADALNQLLLNQPRIEHRLPQTGRLRVFVSGITLQNTRLAGTVLKQNVTIETPSF